MKKNICLFFSTIFFALLVFTNCTRDPEVDSAVINIKDPETTTTCSRADITVQVFALSSHESYLQGPFDVKIYYSTYADFSENDNVPSVSAVIQTNGKYVASLTNLTDATQYYYKVKLSNSISSAIFGPYQFRTQDVQSPELANTAVYNVNYSTASFSSSVTANGGTEITEWGFCWGTDPNPTLESCSGHKSVSLSGSLASNATGLNAGTTYHVRAYARNSRRLSYSGDASFTTEAYHVPTVVTLSINADSVSYTWANARGRVDAAGAESIVARGFYYSTNPNPYPNGQKVNANGTGLGQFWKSLNGLQSGTKYYICAYAQNSAGRVGTGVVVSFTTK